MRAASVSRAHWQPHVNAVNPPPGLRRWLTLRSSLTSRLRGSCRQFRVQRLRQQPVRSLPEEQHLVGMARSGKVRMREVLLCCDDIPVVFAHTVVPMRASIADWPQFRKLGEKSLGTTLFGDPLVARGKLQFARLGSSHPLARRIVASVPHGKIEYPLVARRCLFRRKNGLMLVTEVFLPGISTLHNLAEQ